MYLGGQFEGEIGCSVSRPVAIPGIGLRVVVGALMSELHLVVERKPLLVFLHTALVVQPLTFLPALAIYAQELVMVDLVKRVGQCSQELGELVGSLVRDGGDGSRFSQPALAALFAVFRLPEDWPEASLRC